MVKEAQEAHNTKKHLLPTSVRLPNEPGHAAMSHTGEGNVRNSQEMSNKYLRKSYEIVNYDKKILRTITERSLMKIAEVSLCKAITKTGYNMLLIRMRQQMVIREGAKNYDLRKL